MVVEAAVEAVIAVVAEAAAIVEAVVVPYPDRVIVVVERLDQVLVELVVVLNAHLGHPKVLDPLRGLVVQGWPIVEELASLGEVELVNWDGVETHIRTLARSLHGMVEGQAGT